MNSFEKTIDVIHRSMDASLLRRDVIANNISNAGVPNYKRSELTFESELKRALESEKQKPALELNLTNSRHIPNWRPRDYQDVEPRRVLDYLTTSKNNGNNVDAEQEIMLALENQLMYTLMAQAENFEFSQVNLVLR
ncbi:MAG: flagellar basal body rod protein FlgB [Spirochaetaceae bacterium]|jgi:flagellar basal-body rod protein FlgB|nr:flagellar basal body rod protein FlgB [Spirochaetaceae bacterium]